MKPYKAYIQGTVLKDRVQVRVQDHLGPATPATGLELYMHAASGTKGATTSTQLYNMYVHKIQICSGFYASSKVSSSCLQAESNRSTSKSGQEGRSGG